MARLIHGRDFYYTTSQGGFYCLSGANDDGTPWTIYKEVVCITLNDGREFFLPNGIVVWVQPENDYAYQTVKNEYDPGVMVEKIIAQGVDISKWTPLEIPSLQEILSDELYKEDMERSGFY